MNELVNQYSRIIEWSEADKCYVGRCPELFLGGCHGDTEAAVTEQLGEIIADVIADYKKARRRLPEPAQRSARLNSAIEARRRSGLNQRNFGLNFKITT